MKKSIMFVGLDVHKDSISIAVAQDGRDGEVRYIGTVGATRAALGKLVARLSGDDVELRLCYEAGPCGYGVYRHMMSLGVACMVVAPSLIPRKPGDRVKTNRRDAEMLAVAHRAGTLTAVWVPDADHEAMRDLVRAREAAVRDVRKARQRLSGFLLRHDRAYGRKAWTQAHRRWLATQAFAHPAQQIAFQEYVDAVVASQARRDRLMAEIEALVPTWSMAPVVAAVQAMRGMGLITAVTLIAEVGDLRRFDKPPQLMAYLGLVPSEDSTGDHTRRGAITKTGNGRARRALIEAAWTYRWPARVSRALADRNAGQPEPVRRIAWDGQRRLCARYRRLSRTGKKPQVVATAIARELLGFAWAIARHVPPRTIA
jgi:transposase